MKKLLLLSLFTIAGAYHAMKPIAAMAMENQSEESIAFLVFKIAAIKALALPQEEALTKLNTLFKETDIKTFNVKAKKFIRERVKEKFFDLKLADLQRYETLYPIIAHERIAHQIAQTAPTVFVKNNSYSINEPNSESDYKTIAELMRYDFDRLFNLTNLSYLERAILMTPLGNKEKREEVKLQVEKMQKRIVSSKIIRNPDGNVIGFVTYEPGVWQTHIDLFCIDADYRRDHLGKELMDAVIDQEKSLGCKKISLYSALEAMRFYHKVGFKFQGEQNIQGATCLVYEKNIAE